MRNLDYGKCGYTRNFSLQKGCEDDSGVKIEDRKDKVINMLLKIAELRTEFRQNSFATTILMEIFFVVDKIFVKFFLKLETSKSLSKIP